MIRRAFFLGVLGTALGALVCLVACEEHFPKLLTTSSAEAVADAATDADAEPDGDVDADDAAVADARMELEGGGLCNARIAAHPIEGAAHAPNGSPLTYATNPPSSGTHYGSWANLQEFDRPVEDGYLVHAMEHGTVLLLYSCADDGGACAAIVDELRAIRDAVPTDPICSPQIRVRIIIAPRPANDTVIAAAAWGHTYRADCVDTASLSAFVTAHYGQGPEQVCAQGSVF